MDRAGDPAPTSTDRSAPTTARPSEPTTARQLAHQEMHRRILSSARRQLTEVGPAQLSLRAVARDLGVASSAVYRYVASRDELITRLILEIYGELGDAVGIAAEAAAADPATQWHTWATTLRRWALGHPYDWALVYGTPVPGYEAPQDTIGPATRVNRPVLDLTGLRAAELGPDDAAVAASVAPMAALARRDAPGQASDQGPSPGTALAMVQAWSAVHGFINLELGGHFVGVLADPAPVFEAMVARTAVDLGIG